jgi:hypothetical protein
MIQQFINWLSTTSVNQTFQTVTWIIPTVQTIHILAIAVVMSSVGIVDFRLLGLGSRSQTITQLTDRFLPWVWTALVVLALSGSMLIIAEPGRELDSIVFWWKMGLLLTVIVVTLLFQSRVKKNRASWDALPTSGAAKMTALISIVLWVGIVTAGRWIAYYDHG